MALAPNRLLFARAVEIDHDLVDLDLLFDRHLAERLEDLAVDGFDRLAHALAEIASLVAVAQFDRLMRAGGGARRHRGAADRAVFQHHVDFDGGIAAAVENFAADDVDDGCHDCLFGECRDGTVGPLLQQGMRAGKGRRIIA